MKHLRSVISAYVTLKKFTQGLQKFYTDISAISATFSNSVCISLHWPLSGLLVKQTRCQISRRQQSIALTASPQMDPTMLHGNRMEPQRPPQSVR